MISIIGGVYNEICMCPNWHETYGSGGRAASAIARIGADVTLHSYVDSDSQDVISSRSAFEGFKFSPVGISKATSFSYHHSLENPQIEFGSKNNAPIHINADHVIRFGLIEGDSIVTANYAVYDPQSPSKPVAFEANGSKANHLAVVLNKGEAEHLCGISGASPEQLAQSIIDQKKAEVVIIKLGPLGAFVLDSSGGKLIPAFRTDHVWKIGSGDTFVAIFGYFWMEKNVDPALAAELASKATAYYCQNMGFPTESQLANFNPDPIIPSQRYLDGFKPNVYLAGPFFSLAQLWLIDEAKKNLKEMGLVVFSPYHDVGKGSASDVVHQDIAGINNCDIMLAIGDGLDSGTMYEIGYARAKGKPVILYSENETSDNRKMMEGTNCILCNDYVTSIYKCLWTAVTL